MSTSMQRRPDECENMDHVRQEIDRLDNLLVDLVAERFGTRHHEIMIDEVDLESYLPALVRQQDEPIADWVCVPLFYVSELAKRCGVTVVQVGEGSDELFCGYDHFRAPLNRHRRYERPLRALPGSRSSSMQ